MHLFSAAYLLPMDGPVVEDAALLVRGDRILAVGRRSDLETSAPEAKRITSATGILLPPLVNAHTHLELTHFPVWRRQAGGTPEPDDFIGWIEQLVGLKRGQGEEELARSLRSGLDLCLRSGTGAVGDILSRPGLLGAYGNSPLLGRVYHELLGVDPVAMEERLAEVAGALNSTLGCLQAGISPHAPYTLSPEVLELVLGFVRRHHLATSIHLAESPAESAFFREGRGPIAERLYPLAGWQDRLPPVAGLSPVAYLRQRGGLQRDTLVVHGVQVGEEDAATMAEAGVTVVVCPRSNEKLGVGLPPVERYHRLGIPLALGTDSLASNDSLSVWDELAFAGSRFSAVLEPRDLLRMATLNGAEALGLEREMGSLTAGKGAHFQVVELAHTPSVTQLEEALCTAGPALRVRQLVLSGKQVLPEA